MSWLRAHGNNVLLTLHIQPGARKTEIAGPHGDALKIRLAAPPVDGKANDALVDYLAQALGVPKASIVIASGHTARRKRLEIRGVQTDQIVALLTTPAS